MRVSSSRNSINLRSVVYTGMKQDRPNLRPGTRILIRSGISLLLILAASFANPSPAPLPEADDAEGNAVLYRFLDASKTNKLSGVQMDAQIDASLPKLQKRGKLQALRTITKLGKITWDRLNFTGDNTIKKDVIARYIQAEQESQDTGKFAITPENYKFKYKGRETRDDKEVHIFQVNPRKKQVGFFKGEIWVDASTYLPLRESGQFVKNPSVFLKKVNFVRVYEIRDGISVPKHVESVVETRFWGKAEMLIDYDNIAKVQEDQAQARLSEPSAGHQ